MFTGWGLRTLSRDEIRFNPMSYHNGSVWPHDTSFAAWGLKRSGFTQEALTLFTGLFDASLYFEDRRMPELFCGFPRIPRQSPTQYPVACNPQTWAAASVISLLRTTLGMTANADNSVLTFDNPTLPPWLQWVEIRNLKIGKTTMDIKATYGPLTAGVEVLRKDGNIKVVIER